MRVNKKQLAEIVGYTEATLTKWQKDGLPIAYSGKIGESNEYETADVIKWMIRREVGKLTVGEDGEVYDYDSERARLTHHQADKAKLEKELLKGQAIATEKVVAVQCSMLGAFRSKMLSLPTKTAGKVQNLFELAEIEDCLRSEVDEALSELSDYDPEHYGISIIQDDSEDSSAAT